MRLKERDPKKFQDCVSQVEAMMALVGVIGMIEVIEGVAKNWARLSSVYGKDIKLANRWFRIASQLDLCRDEVAEIVEGRVGNNG